MFTYFSWFVISVITFASLCDTVGRTLSDYFDIVPKHWFVLSVAIRSLFFIATYMSTYENFDK